MPTPSGACCSKILAVISIEIEKCTMLEAFEMAGAAVPGSKRQFFPAMLIGA